MHQNNKLRRGRIVYKHHTVIFVVKLCGEVIIVMKDIIF